MAWVELTSLSDCWAALRQCTLSRVCAGWRAPIAPVRATKREGYAHSACENDEGYEARTILRPLMSLRTYFGAGWRIEA